MLRALEADPRLLVHGFGRVSRAGFVVEVRVFVCARLLALVVRDVAIQI